MEGVPVGPAPPKATAEAGTGVAASTLRIASCICCCDMGFPCRVSSRGGGRGGGGVGGGGVGGARPCERQPRPCGIGWFGRLIGVVELGAGDCAGMCDWICMWDMTVSCRTSSRGGVGGGGARPCETQPRPCGIGWFGTLIGVVELGAGDSGGRCDCFGKCDGTVSFRTSSRGGVGGGGARACETQPRPCGID